MNEKDFLLRQTLKVKVICHRGRKNPRNPPDAYREMVTVTEFFGADGRVIPLMYIYKESRNLLGWHAGMQDKEQATFAWSSKRWTDNQLGLEWVEENFEKYTNKMFVP
jgi:hypothetical protein